MGRAAPGTFQNSWSAPAYSVGDDRKVVGGYTPGEPNNWDRWGDDDQRGTANLIDAAKVLEGAALVRRGEVFSLALPIDSTAPAYPLRPPNKHYFTITGSDAVVGSPNHAAVPHFVYTDDVLEIHTHSSTQWDALAHVSADDSFYNGFWAGTVTGLGGAAALGIERMSESFVGRGVLLDVARQLGVEAMDPGEAISPQTLDEACERQGVEVGSGDMLLIRTGHLTHWWALETDEQRRAWYQGPVPGLGYACVEWLAERDVAAVAADNNGVEVIPTDRPGPEPFPVHPRLLVDLGLTIGELWELDALAADCAADGVYEFLLVAPPLNLRGGVGSPLNPVAVK